MKIINKTTYKTTDLKRFLMAGHKAHGADTQKVVRVVWSRHNTHWGCATYSGSRMTLTIPKGDLNMAKLALVFEHELAHNLGLRHKEMDEETMWGMHRHPLQMPEWAAGLELGQKEEPSKMDPAAIRETHARKMLEQWEKKLKTAKCQRQKWALKVRYYDRKTAASPAQKSGESDL